MTGDGAAPAEVAPDDGATDRGELVAGEQPAPLVIRRRGRRVSTEPTPGYAGEPGQEPQQSSENDERLRQDVPPHWG